MIQLDGICKSFGENKVLSSLDLSAKKGEMFVLLGSSGCGKTTTLSVIAGLTKEDKGDIYIDGSRINDTPPHKRGIGFVFQKYALFPHLNVYENVEFGLKAGNKRGNQSKRGGNRTEVKRAMELVGLDGFEKRNPMKLSGGEQQRVALARALATEPECILMDEPLSNLDAVVRERLRHEIAQLQRDIGLTSIYVTHDQVEAMALGDRIAVLNNGRVEEAGTPEKIFYKPEKEFVARFTGMKNIFKGKITAIDEDNGVAQISTGNFDLTTVFVPSSVGTRVKACVRPEEIILAKSDRNTSARSARNEIAGRIIRIFPNGPLMRVLVDVKGDEMSVDITRLAARDLGLGEGDRVLLTFKATSVHVIL
ncbi:MAG: ABC transporter ATP-binding protein [Methanosarcinales archaeon]|nr:MAG: ABC transporter ATP-binding protein [Methanosarcinales archaeon]